MRLDILDAHDRYSHFTKQNFDIGECCQDLINKRPFGNRPFYIFAHTRTEPDGATKRLIWQPRLTKPKAQENSMLFKGYPGTDKVKVIWMIPESCLWKQFSKNELTQNNLIKEFIYAYQHKRAELEAPEEDDLSDEEIDKIYKELSQEARKKANQKSAEHALLS